MYAIGAIESAAVLGYAIHYGKYEWFEASAVVSMVCAFLGWIEDIL